MKTPIPIISARLGVPKIENSKIVPSNMKIEMNFFKSVITQAKNDSSKKVLLFYQDFEYV